MPESSVVITRIALGAMIGVLIGLGGFVLVPVVMEQPDPWLRWGILFWYPSLGATIGALLRDSSERLPRWVIGGLFCGWMNTVLTFFAHDQMARFLADVFTDGTFTSPFWFVLEGAVVGAVIGLVIDRFGTD